jgi:hypothetical protein
MNVEQAIVYSQPTSEDERAEIAQACVLHLEFEMPMLLDAITNEVDDKYIALPERLYVIDAQGAVTFRCELGPFGFDPDGWEQAIRDVIGD